MSNAYVNSISSGSMTYNSDVREPITTPLNRYQYPYSLSTCGGKGMFDVVNSTPMQFFPSQVPQNSSIERNEYKRVVVSDEKKQIQLEKGKNSTPTAKFHIGTRTYSNASTHMNYIPPKDSSTHISNLKRNAIGKSLQKTPISTKDYSPSYTRSMIGRVRSGGSVAPPKKGISRINTCGGGICVWGANRSRNGFM